MKKWMLCFVTLLLFLSLAVPVWADDGSDQVVFFGDSVVIGPGEEVDGTLTVIGGSLDLREGGRVRGDVVALGGETIVDGRIDGNLVVVGGTLDLRSHATIAEDLVTFGASVSRAEGATVLGESIEGFRGKLPPLRVEPWIPRLPVIRERWRSPNLFFGDVFGSLVRWVVRTIAWMALGVVVMLLLPKQTVLVGQTVSEVPLPSAGVGMLTFVVLLVLVPLLVIICIGIPVVLLLAIAFVAAQVLGRVAIGAIIGQRLLAALNAKQPQPLFDVAVGIALIELFTAVPCLGGLLGWIVSLTGVGAVVLTRFGTTAYEPLSKPSELPAPLSESELEIEPEEEAHH